MNSLTGKRPVDPVKPLAPYLGGKRNLAPQIIDRIESIPHTTYAEPFVGMGGVFFRRRTAPKCEIINDLSRDIATLFRVAQRHYVPLAEMMRFQITTRAEFERLVATNPDTLTDLERAARFLYLQRTAFGGKVAGRTFGVSVGRPSRFDVTQVLPLLEDIHARLTGVTIECLPYQAFLERYDSAATLFYLDPPYIGCETDYGRDLFDRIDFERLAEILKHLKGSFLLSINDTPDARRWFGDFDIEPVRTSYSVNKGRATDAKELIVSSARKSKEL